MRRRTARELTALADGNLPPERREALRRRIAKSPKLSRAFERQLIAIKAVRQLVTHAPPDLRKRIQQAVHSGSWPG